MNYWCMVDFGCPNYLGTKTEFSNMFERPVTNGQCLDSTPTDVKLMRYRAYVVYSLLEGCVQRSELIVSDLLKEYTSGLLESVGKMVILFKVLEESLAIGEKILVFREKVSRPDMNENWCKNQSYFILETLRWEHSRLMLLSMVTQIKDRAPTVTEIVTSH
uniref:Uncharacterized protein n=1 Tax=Magallana gigas TaxID=29159 RepID=A0A8W8LL39_MAGGI